MSHAMKRSNGPRISMKSPGCIQMTHSHGFQVFGTTNNHIGRRLTISCQYTHSPVKEKFRKSKQARPGYTASGGRHRFQFHLHAALPLPGSGSPWDSLDEEMAWTSVYKG